VIVSGSTTRNVRRDGGVLDISRLIEDIAAQNKPAFAIADVDEIVQSLTRELRSGDVVAIMSNGAFGDS